MEISKNINWRETIIGCVIILWYILLKECYQYVGLSSTSIYSALSAVIGGVMVIVCVREIFNFRFHKYLSLLAVGVIFSMIISVIYWDASPFYALRAHGSDIGLLYVVVFFALKKWNVSPSTIQIVLIVLSVIYLLCWAYSIYKLPEMVFGVDRDDNYGQLDRGFYRMFIPGNCSAVLSFLFLGKFLYENKKWGLVGAFCMLIIVILHVGRQMVAWTLLISVLMTFMRYRKNLLYLVFAAVIGYYGLISIAKEVPAVEAMIELSEDQSEDFSEDIRIKAVKYFISEYPHNILTTVWGNGVPVVGTELYRIKENGIRNGYYHEDVGFFSMYCNYGIWCVALSLLLLVRIYRLKVEVKYEYLKYFIYYEYGTYLMSQALTASFFVVMLAYYILEVSAVNNDRVEGYKHINE